MSIFRWLAIHVILVAVAFFLCSDASARTHIIPADAGGGMTYIFQGTVRDVAGQPVSGATVYADVETMEGFGEYWVLAKATTDATGRYDLRASGPAFVAMATLLAYKPGMPPAVRYASVLVPSQHNPRATQPASRPFVGKPVPVDFVLAAAGGTLDVRVIEDRNPVPGATVRIARKGGDANCWRQYVTDAAIQKELDAIDFPSAKTGPHGIVHFTDLPPGQYDIDAAIDGNSLNPFAIGAGAPWMADIYPNKSPPPFGCAQSAAVRAGSAAKQDVILYPPANSVTFLVRRADGKPFSSRAEYDVTSASAENGQREVNFDAAGILTKWFSSPGIKNVSFRYRDSRAFTAPIPEPYSDASVAVAVSPRIFGGLTVKIMAQPVVAGSVSVDLCDSAGHPAKGIVSIGYTKEDSKWIASTDENGHARFEHLPRGEYVLRAKIDGQRGADFEMFRNAPIPTDAQLIDRTFIPNRPLTIRPNTDQHLELRALPAGYVRGVAREFVTGHVYRADGKPADDATLYNAIPETPSATLSATTDAVGEILGRYYATLINLPPADASGSPVDPVLVAMLPGDSGATIVDVTAGFAKPLSITLPPPIAWHGTLTLASQKITGQIGQFRVLAEYQGKGRLNGILSVWATPQPDGTFELAGLTPGTYKVQASLDNIWSSDTVTIVASAKKPMAAIHLDIPSPGGPAIVHVTSEKGKPLVGVQVMVDRPAGPLTELDWPAAFTADGAGDVWIPALEAGKHTVRLKDGSGSAEFAVPPLPADKPVDVHLTER